MPSLLDAEGLSKSFGGVRAVANADLSVVPGQVHGLVGENGAGKSTLVKMLSGIVRPDSGTLRWLGAPTELKSPQDATRRGIRNIHQELELALPLTVAENVFMGNLPTTRFGVVDHRRLHADTAAILAELGTSFDARATVEHLSIGDRQVVEIARAVAADSRVIFMDEPTSALPPREVDKLFALIDRLRRRDVGIVYISHRLDEVTRISDVVTVMRNGEIAASLDISDVTRDDLVAHILGRDLTTAQHAVSWLPPEGSARPAVEVKALHAGSFLRGVSLVAYPSEIVGLYGLLGAGHNQLIRALFGDYECDVGAATVGRLDRLPSNPRQAIAAGVAYVPGDRKDEGLALVLSVAENVLLPTLSDVATWGVVDRGRAATLVRGVTTDYGIRHSGASQPVGDLSGGNQQKVVLGKWSLGEQLVILLDEPTKGVDIGARSEIFALLRQFVAGGGACLMSSSDPDEVVAICNRAYVMKEGSVAGTLTGQDLTASNLVELAL